MADFPQELSISLPRMIFKGSEKIKLGQDSIHVPVHFFCCDVIQYV